MTVRTLAAAVLLLPASLALADADFTRTLSVAAQPDLYVATGSGTIRITEGSSDKIEIHGHVHASNGWSGFGGGGDREEQVKRVAANPPITQEGNAVHVGDHGDRRDLNNISIEYDIKVPAEVALNLHTGSGDVTVDHVGRFLAANTGSGSVRAHGIHGKAELQTGSGDIELEQTAAGDVSAKTGSGSVRLRGLNGGLSASTGSGDIEANGHLSGAARLSTGSGSVRLHLTPDSKFNLDAATSSGSVRVNFPGAANRDDEASRHRFNGPVNGGGPDVNVHTGSGDIEVSAS